MPGSIMFAPGGAVVYPSGGSAHSYMLGGVTIPCIRNDRVVDLKGTNIFVAGGQVASASSATFTSGLGTYNRGGAFYTYSGRFALANCTVSGNGANGVYGGGLAVFAGGAAYLSNCVVCGNAGVGDIYLQTDSAFLFINGGTYGATLMNAGKMEIAGQNTIGMIAMYMNPGTVTVSSGAIIDLTGNSNTTPINPGGGVTFLPGGATVYPSAGSASAYVIGGMTLPGLGKTNVVDLNGKNVIISRGGTAYAGECTFSGGSGAQGEVFDVLNTGSLVLNSVTLTGNTGFGAVFTRGKATLNHCTMSNNGYDNTCLGLTEFIDCTAEQMAVWGGTISFAGTNSFNRVWYTGDTPGYVTISSGASINLTSAIFPGSTGRITVQTGGCTVNGAVIPAGTYTQIVSSGGSAIAS